MDSGLTAAGSFFLILLTILNSQLTPKDLFLSVFNFRNLSFMNIEDVLNKIIEES